MSPSNEGPARSLRLTAVAALATIMMAVLAACSPSGGIPADDPRNQEIVALDEYREQELRWEACDDYAVSALDEQYFPAVPQAECARLRVPLDYADPTGATASVAVVRIPARGDSLGSLFYNPGGPGGPGILGAMAASTLMPQSAVTESFDLIGFDPRGVGATTPTAQCGLADGSEEGAELLAKASGAFVPLTEDDTKALVDRCAKGSGGVAALAQMGTRTTAKDMDILRAALGEKQMNYLGQSYGTRLGAVYAEEFPENVRAMILDGAFDPNLSSQDRLLASYAGFQDAFDALAAACAVQADCPLGTDPARASDDLQGILQPLAETPLQVGDAELDFHTALGGVIGGLYSPDAWPDVIEGLREVQQGRGDTLLALALGISGLSSEGASTNQIDASLVINCVDETLLRADDLASLRDDTYERAPIMDPGTTTDDGLRDKCADFPRTGELDVPYAQDIEGLAPTLVVSLTRDPTTPLSGAVALADTLGGTLLTVDGDGHTVIARSANACADAIAASYLIDLELPEEGTTCPAE
ncbi:alpha/beta fold hydrolase [Microbacterium sp. NPDC089695]|uniref:alpha/beta fold hydrolase n=1 Tax=Microbacterium sp. NPDC089695 TaxID=3364198 RepID=UPI003825020A